MLKRKTIKYYRIGTKTFNYDNNNICIRQGIFYLYNFNIM